MTEDTRPEGIRVAVPDSFGPAFGEGEERQWVERKVYIGLGIKKELSDLDEGLLTQDKVFDKACELLSGMVVAWGLKDENGEALPDPWQNPEAFKILADASLDLFLWVSRVLHTPLGLLVAVPKN